MEQELTEFIVDAFMQGTGTIAANQHLFESGVVDSLGFIKLLSFLEDKYSVRIAMSEIAMDKFATIGDIAEFIQGKLSRPAN